MNVYSIESSINDLLSIPIDKDTIHYYSSMRIIFFGKGIKL